MLTLMNIFHSFKYRVMYHTFSIGYLSTLGACIRKNTFFGKSWKRPTKGIGGLYTPIKRHTWRGIQNHPFHMCSRPL